MKISFWIPAIVLWTVSITFSNSVQVGTVLFTTTDLVRRCWTENDKSVLRARLIMQDLLPDPDCIDFSNPKAAVVLLDYFLACYEIINKFCYGKVQNLMYVALSDALGGYLRAFVLPAAKRGYYAGQIKYSEAEQIFRLYDNIRVFLKTNGGGWAVPQKLCKKNFHVSPLVITGGSFEACKQLRIIEKRGKLHCINPHYSHGCPELKKIKSSKNSTECCPNKNCKNSKVSAFLRKRSLRGGGTEEDKVPEKIKDLNSTTTSEKVPNTAIDTSTNDTNKLPEDSKISDMKTEKCECTCPNCTNTHYSKRVVVPLPMLDDCQNPHSIAVPFKNWPFRNLHSASSAFILEYYYMAVIKCFIAAGNSLTDIKNFNVEFYSWLISQVVPHLNEEKWYPGFGGVLRVIETIKKFGGESGLNEPSFHDTGYVFGKGVAFDVGDEKEGKDQPRNIADGNAENTKRHVITAILVVSLLWLFLFCACAFYSQATRKPCNVGNKCSWTSSMSRSCSRTCSRSCSETQSGSRLRCMSPLQKKNSKSMSLQFLVKFFKKRDGQDGTLNREKEKKVCWNVKKIGNDKLPATLNQFPQLNNQTEKCIKKKQDLKILDDKTKTVMHGQGDFGLFKNEEFFKPILSNWPCRGYFGKKKIKFAPAGDAKLAQPHEHGSKLFLLWKKPSIMSRRSETCRRSHRKSSRERCKLPASRSGILTSYTTSADSRNFKRRRDRCSCCSVRTSTSATNCSSRSKGNTMLSTTTTMECFEDLKAKRKPFLESLILASTDESECDDEESTSYESDI